MRVVHLRAAVLEPGEHCIANFLWQGQSALAPALAGQHDPPARPVDLFKAQAAHILGPEAQSGEQKQDRPVPAAGRAGLVTGGEQPFDIGGPQAARQMMAIPVGDGGHCRDQPGIAPPHGRVIAQPGPQHGDCTLQAAAALAPAPVEDRGPQGGWRPTDRIGTDDRQEVAQPLGVAPHRDLRKTAMSAQPVEIRCHKPAMGIVDRRVRQHARCDEIPDEPLDPKDITGRPETAPAHAAAMAIMPGKVLSESVCCTLERPPRQMRPGTKMPRGCHEAVRRVRTVANAGDCVGIGRNEG